MATIKGEIIEISKRFDDINMHDFWIVVVLTNKRPNINFDKNVIIKEVEK